MTPERIAIEIRTAEIRDASLLAELGARTFYEAFAAGNRPDDVAAFLASKYSAEKQKAELADSRSRFFIAEIDHAPVGYALLFSGEAPTCVRGPGPIELARLYVSGEWHGRGVGEALMDRSLAAAREQGYGTIWLGVWEHNARAIAFYRRWGFREVGSHIFQLGSDPQTDLLMARSLSEEDGQEPQKAV